MTEPTGEENPILGYVLRIPAFGPQGMLFEEFRQLSDVLDAELADIDHGDEVVIHVGRQWTTQQELATLPEFDGW